MDVINFGNDLFYFRDIMNLSVRASRMMNVLSGAAATSNLIRSNAGSCEEDEFGGCGHTTSSVRNRTTIFYSFFPSYVYVQDSSAIIAVAEKGVPSRSRH